MKKIILGFVLGFFVASVFAYAEFNNAILGHWVSLDNKNSHYYFSQDKLIRISKNEVSYKIVESNPKTRQLKLYIQGEKGGHDELLQLGSNDKSFVKTTKLFDSIIKEHFKYVDSKQTP